MNSKKKIFYSSPECLEIKLHVEQALCNVSVTGTEKFDGLEDFDWSKGNEN